MEPENTEEHELVEQSENQLSSPELDKLRTDLDALTATVESLSATVKNILDALPATDPEPEPEPEEESDPLQELMDELDKLEESI